MWLPRVLLACLVSGVGQAHAASATQEPLPLYVVSNGWHAGLLMPASGVDTAVPALRQRFPNAAYYEIGWGDEGFYQAKEITLRLVLQALFASRGSVLHVVAVTEPLDQHLKGSTVAKTCVDRAGYAALVGRVAGSFARDANGGIVMLRRGIYGDSQFYRARGRYNALHTCNRWTAGALRDAGLGLWPWFRLTADSVIRAVRKHGQSCA